MAHACDGMSNPNRAHDRGVSVNPCSVIVFNNMDGTAANQVWWLLANPIVSSPPHPIRYAYVIVSPLL